MVKNCRHYEFLEKKILSFCFQGLEFQFFLPKFSAKCPIDKPGLGKKPSSFQVKIFVIIMGGIVILNRLSQILIGPRVWWDYLNHSQTTSLRVGEASTGFSFRYFEKKKPQGEKTQNSRKILNSQGFDKICAVFIKKSDF